MVEGWGRFRFAVCVGYGGFLFRWYLRVQRRWCLRCGVVSGGSLVSIRVFWRLQGMLSLISRKVLQGSNLFFVFSS